MPALTPADLPQAVFHVKKTSWGGGGFQIVVLDPEGELLGELSIAIPLGMGECHGAYEVTRSWAELKGIGPLLYDVAMELAGKRGIMSDRRSVSSDARRVWKFYDSRSDTKKKQLDNPQGWLTPEDDSDDCRQDSAGKNWVESPLSRVNYKNSTPVLDDLRRRGMLRMASGKTATTIPEILGNCGPKVTQRADKVKYKRKRLSPSGLSTWVATGSKGEQYIVRVKPIRKDKRLKRVVKMPIQIACSCPYFRWQGPEHWAVQNDYLYGKPRGTASVPVIKDPLSEHWACKHVIAVLRLVQRYRYAADGEWDWTGPVAPVSPHELDEELVRRVASVDVYKPLSEASSKTRDLLDKPTPSWLDRDYPYVSPPGSEGSLRELDYLVSLIPLRDKWYSFIKAADEDSEGLFLTLCAELGVPCSRETLEELVSDALILITKLKWLYNRPRPYQVAAKHNRLRGQGGVAKVGDFYPMSSVSAHTPAYPSGHTIQAYLLASRLSELAPQHRKAFMDLAHKISYSRAVAGYHWPSDLTFAKDIFRHIVLPHMPSSVRVAAKYLSPGTVPPKG